MTGFVKPNRAVVGKRIRKVKDELGLSLTELGNKLGLKKTNLNAYIRGANLAPVEVVEKLANLSGKSLGWFYFGDLEDYIKDYLTLRGHELVLANYPDIPLQIKNKFLTLESSLATDERIYPQGAISEFGYPSEDFILIEFELFRKSTLQDYILSLTTDFINGQTSLKGSSKEETIALISADVTSFALGSSLVVLNETIAYGDKDVIQMLIRNSYESIKDEIISFDDTYLVGKLINILNDDEETANLIRILSAHFTGMDFLHAEDSQELMDIVQSLRPALIGLYAKKSQNDFHDWFEVPKLAKELEQKK